MDEPRTASPPASWADHLSRWRDLLPRPSPQVAAAGLVAVVVAVVGVVLLARQSAPPPLALPRATAGGPAAAPPTPGSDSTGGGRADTAAVITVHAAGAVARPGVYAVAGGARVADVVATAGGPTPAADLDQLNLAARVTDGQRVYVPRKGETVAPPAADGAASAAAGPPNAAQPVDLNAATDTQLDALPGIGPALARAIVQYRTKHGSFHSVTDLLQVPGIGPAKLDAIRALVRV